MVRGDWQLAYAILQGILGRKFSKILPPHTPKIDDFSCLFPIVAATLSAQHQAA